VNVVFQDKSGEASGKIPIAVTVPYAKEYAATTHNAALLYEVARRTKGRVLSFDDQLTVELFDSEGLHVPMSPTSVWDLIAMIAAGLLILDVAIRRLWIDKRSMQSMFAPVGEVSRLSVEALKKVHEAQPLVKEVQVEEIQKKVHEEPTPKIKEKLPSKPREDSLGKLLKKKRERGDE